MSKKVMYHQLSFEEVASQATLFFRLVFLLLAFKFMNTSYLLFHDKEAYLLLLSLTATVMPGISWY
jgi:hypothetical protein